MQLSVATAHQATPDRSARLTNGVQRIASGEDALVLVFAGVMVAGALRTGAVWRAN